ncbi:MAG: hypothetical protein ACD_58C00296G0006 [uncultured bacterium]|nr:MAG: hypothetical protein ACD_58C00296G0006 [uncultured bacterium]
MRVIADLHFHSKYSRAVSPKMVIPEIIKWANYKGLNLVGSTDFTHPLWLSHLKETLEPIGNGLFKCKNQIGPKVMLTTEVSSIYSQGGRGRRIHNLIFAPSFETVEKINKKLGSIGNLYSDGRPILGISAKDLVKIVLDIDSTCMIIPAHAWTPWFSVFGSKSGFDTIKECYGEMTPYIYAIETGLSSDPEMNWRLSLLDKITLISNSDSHSLPNLGREANIFEVENDNYDYNYICEIIKAKDPKYFPSTIEFYPEEGIYHWDGHRACDGTKLHPDETKKLGGICPVCAKPLTIGVLNRVNELADRKEGYKPEGAPASIHLVPLQEIIAEVIGSPKLSQKVQDKYLELINIFDNEYSILLDKSEKELSSKLESRIVEGIMNVRNNKVQAIAGYDGVYGLVKVLNNRV